MKRKYSSALEYFSELLESLSKNELELELRCRERIAQTNISLGNLMMAEKVLVEIKDRVKQVEQSLGDRTVHHYAMLYRHKATLGVVRMLLISHAPTGSTMSRDTLLVEALDAANNLEACSKTVGYLPGHFGQRDEIGIGLAWLKRAQAHYAAMNYEEALNAAEIGTEILSQFSNSRWWRMCCHELATKAAAMKGDLTGAKKHLEKAKAVFLDSGKEDRVRECELDHSEGVLAMQQGRGKEAVRLIRKSLGFVEEKYVNPCIEFTHRIDLVKALLMAGEPEEAMAELERAERITISW